MAFDEVLFQQLNKRISELCSDQLITDKKDGLIYLLLVQRFLREADEFRESLVDGGNDCGVDAIFIDQKADEPIIHVIQSKVYESTRKAGNPFKWANFEKIHRFFEIVKDRTLDLPKFVNPALHQKILEIRDSQDNDFPKFKIWLISNGSPCAPHEISPIVTKFKKQGIEFEEFHVSSFVEFCINKYSTRPEHVFYVREAGVLERGDTELNSVVGYISARELYNKILKSLSDERKMDYSLFDMNVRGFLGMDKAINQEIFKSASSKNNFQFSSLNNGITMVGTKVKVMKTGDIPKIGIKKLSIVNGAQTCSAIFDCMKDQYPDFSNFDKLSIIFRLFETEDQETIEKIAISTNSQNRIDNRDLRANDSYQMNLEIELEKHGIHYKRKRGGFDSRQDAYPQLDALKAGQLLLSFVHLDPAVAKKQSDYIFDKWYNRVFGNVDVLKLVRAFSLYSKIEERQEFISDEIRIRGSSRTENTFITYGGFHILALCSVLESAAPDKTDEELIKDAIDIIAQTLSEEGEPAHYSFFRDPVMTKKMISKCSQPSLFSVLKTGSDG